MLARDTCGHGLILSGMSTRVREKREYKMEASDIAREIASLPPEVQKQVEDFVAFLQACYSSPKAVEKASRTELADEPFTGMWRGRTDMHDSSEWVRNLRQSEWECAG
jgi:hypothetical protein